MKEIPLDKEIDKFKLHLENNPRVIFSAQFGDGKSHFLRKFIKTTSDDISVLTLYPLKYSIAPNENIMEYIKRDILIQLANEGIYEDIDFEAFADSLFSLENTISLVNFLVSALPGGELVGKLIGKGLKLKNDYDEKKHSLDKYEDSFTLQSGGIYERDAYTKLIEATVVKIKNSSKRTVLLIEDLDRIDPNHLFRILNVLGAHIDDNAESNKFGFDNIVVVLDFKITEHIFHHFYGDNANYHGYISKFVSHYPYRYSITSIARAYLNDFIEKNCGLDQQACSYLELTTFPERKTLSSYINVMSVRDIVNVLDGLETQFDHVICTFQNNVSIHTDEKIVLLLALLRRMEVPIKHHILKKSILNLDDGKGLNLLGRFMLHDQCMLQSNCIELSLHRWRPRTLRNEDGTMTCCFLPVNVGNTANKKADYFIDKALRHSYRFIHDLDPNI